MGCRRRRPLLVLELVDMATAHAKFTFPGSGAIKSPPFVTGFDFSCDSALDMEATVGNLDEWWTAATAFRNLLDVALDNPVITCQGEFGGVQYEFAQVATDAPAGGAPALPGASLRAVKIANRPRGGRRGSMFWPGLESTAYDSQGDLVTGIQATAETALTGLLASIAVVTGQEMVQVHTIGGVTTTAAVYDWFIAGSVSFLNRRYR